MESTVIGQSLLPSQLLRQFEADKLFNSGKYDNELNR